MSGRSCRESSQRIYEEYKSNLPSRHGAWKQSLSHWMWWLRARSPVQFYPTWDSQRISQVSESSKDTKALGLLSLRISNVRGIEQWLCKVKTFLFCSVFPWKKNQRTHLMTENQQKCEWIKEPEGKNSCLILKGTEKSEKTRWEIGSPFVKPSFPTETDGKQKKVYEVLYQEEVERKEPVRKSYQSKYNVFKKADGSHFIWK